MMNIAPVSDLRNFSKLLRKIAIGSPLILTKNGRSKYVDLDVEEYEEIERELAYKKLVEVVDEEADVAGISLAEMKARFNVD
jgi:malate/lactate dehydrogenase